MGNFDLNKNYLFEMVGQTTPAFCSGTDSYFGTGEEIVELKDKIIGIGSKSSNNSECFIEYINDIVQGKDIETKYNLCDYVEKQRIFECKVIHETEWIKFKGNSFVEVNPDYDKELFFESFEYKFFYVHIPKYIHGDWSVGSEYKRFVNFKFKGLYEKPLFKEVGMEAFDYYHQLLNKLLKGRIAEIKSAIPRYEKAPYKQILSDLTKRMYETTLECKIIYPRGNEETIIVEDLLEYEVSCPEMNFCTLESFVSHEDIYFYSIDELKSDIKKPKEINLWYALGDLVPYGW